MCENLLFQLSMAISVEVCITKQCRLVQVTSGIIFCTTKIVHFFLGCTAMATYADKIVINRVGYDPDYKSAGCNN